MDTTAVEAEELQDPAMLREAYAAELRRQRASAGLTQDQLAERIQYSPGLVSMIETGRRPPSPDFTARCDTALHTGGILTRLLPSRSAYPTWFRDFVELEAEATSIREVEVQVIPGLLQTQDYARAVLRNDWPPNSHEEIERRLAARVTRQQILDRETPPLLWAIVAESVLHVPVGGAALMRDQFGYLVSLADRPHVQLQVLTCSGAARAPMGGAFFVLGFKAGEPIAYTEGLASSQVVNEPENVEKYARAFEAMQSRALSPEDSTELIARMMGEM